MHEFIDRQTGNIIREEFYGDKVVKFLYSTIRENPNFLYKIFTSKRVSEIFSFFLYDSFLGAKLAGTKTFMKKMGIDLTECFDSPDNLDTPRKIFERKIRYWETRPLPEEEDAIVSPADSKVTLGSSMENKYFYIKNKFFDHQDLLGAEKKEWHKTFEDGDFAIFRLTPEKYHYTHVPVTGVVIDFYSIDGVYNSCHPEALISICHPYSKNKRFVTVIDTDIEGGTNVGIVAMIEIVALLIGDIVQCYSEYRYDNPVKVSKGILIKKGQPKSLFRPGSSTVILFFQKNRIKFAQDLLKNSSREDVNTIFSKRLGIPVVETDVKVRSLIGWPLKKDKHTG